MNQTEVDLDELNHELSDMTILSRAAAVDTSGPPLNFKVGSHSDAKFTATGMDHSQGTLYLAIANPNETLRSKSYLFYDDGQFFLNIVPRLLSLENGGTNNDGLSDAPSNSVIIKDTTSRLTYLSSQKGAFYSTGTNAAPTFGTLPVGCGGTGKNSVTTNALLLGNGTTALKELKVGTKGQIIGSNGTIPGWYTPAISFTSTAKTATLNLTLATSLTANLPVASETSAGIVTADTTAKQVFKGEKEFLGPVTIHDPIFVGTFSIGDGTDAYYNSNSDYADGDLKVPGGITVGQNLRVDGTQIQFNRSAKIQYDSTKTCFNFIFP